MKTILALFSIFAVSSLTAFAQLRPASRYLDIGIDAGFGFSQNTFGITEDDTALGERTGGFGSTTK